MKVEIGDLLTDCPVADLYPLPTLIEFRRKWSHQIVELGAPVQPDPAFRMMPWACDTDLIWPVVGPAEFIAELQYAREPYVSPLEREPGPVWRMWLCRHQIVGD